ncbi:MAG: cell division protein FtsL [Gammaproteobacteria bacterium]|nr:MAG: cell division protein FtsL [Gammaproteobacteria bacterium]
MRMGGLLFDLAVIVLLFAAVVVSALAGVTARHESRQLFIELQRLESERDRLQVDWGRLQIEQGALATHGRIEAVVRRELMMRSPRPEDIMIVSGEP